MLTPTTSRASFGDRSLPVGEALYVGFTDFPATGMDDIHFTSASVTGVPSGLRIQAIGAVSVSETSVQGQRHYIGALTQDFLSQGYPHLRLHPVSDAIITPGRVSDWYLVVVVVATSAGDYLTEGLAVSYSAPGTDGNIQYNYQIRVHAVSPS